MAFRGDMACQVEQQGPGAWAEVPGVGSAHMAYECPVLHGEGSRQDIRRMTFARLLGEDDRRMVVPLFQRAYCWGSADSLHKASWHSVAGRMTSLVDGWRRDVAGEGVGVVAAQCREGHPQARYRDRGAVLCLGGQQTRCT